MNHFDVETVSLNYKVKTIPNIALISAIALHFLLRPVNKNCFRDCHHLYRKYEHGPTSIANMAEKSNMQSTLAASEKLKKELLRKNEDLLTGYLELMEQQKQMMAEIQQLTKKDTSEEEKMDNEPIGKKVNPRHYTKQTVTQIIQGLNHYSQNNPKNKRPTQIDLRHDQKQEQQSTISVNTTTNKTNKLCSHPDPTQTSASNKTEHNAVYAVIAYDDA